MRLKRNRGEGAFAENRPLSRFSVKWRSTDEYRAPAA